MTATPNTGTPDWQRGVVGAGKLLATIAAGTNTATVDVPPNAQTVLISYREFIINPAVTVVGVTSGLSYPGIQRTWQSGLGGDPVFLFSVLPALDAQVVVTWSGVLTVPTYIYSMTATEIVDVPELAGLLVQPVNETDQEGVLIVGYDGTNYQAVKTDNTGELLVRDQSVLEAMAQPGWGAPGQLVAMGGQYSGTLEPIQTDYNGRLIPQVPTQGLTGTLAAGTTQIAPDTSPSPKYLYGLDIAAAVGVQATVTLTDAGGDSIGMIVTPTTGESKSIDIKGFTAYSAVSIITDQPIKYCLRYFY